MYCPKCYRQNDDSRTTCIKCGAKLRKPLISKENAGKAFNAIKSDVDKRVAKKAAQDEKINNLGESWKKTFKGMLTPTWSLTDKGIIFKNEVYDFTQITDVVESGVPAPGKPTGVIQLFIGGKAAPLSLAYSLKEKADAREALVYIIENLDNQEVKQRYLAQSEDAVRKVRKLADDCRQGELSAESGLDTLRKLEEDIVLMTSDIQREIDAISCELSELYEKELAEYLAKAEAARISSEHRMRCNVCGHIFCYTDKDVKENTQNAALGALSAIGGLASVMGGGTIMHTHHLQGQADRYTDKIIDYSRCPSCNSGNISEIKEAEMTQQTISAPAPAPVPVPAPAVSPVEEIKQYKELLDMGIITQEEFNAKKKQLLGL